MSYFMLSIVVALCLYWQSRQLSAILVKLVSYFDFPGPRKGDCFVQFCFLESSLVSVYIYFIKFQYFSLVLIFLLMKPKLRKSFNEEDGNNSV